MSRLTGAGNESETEATDDLAAASTALAPTAALLRDQSRTDAAQVLLSSAGGSPALDRLAQLAAQLLSAPSAQISLLTTAQTVAAGAGLDEGAVGAEGTLDASLCTVTATSGETLVVHDARVDERVATLPPVTSGVVGSYLGAPLVIADGSAIGALCVFGPEPRSWSTYDVTLLEQLAAAVMAELQLSALSAEYEASRVRWDVALDAAGIGSFDWDLATDRVDWDQRLQELYGYRPGEFVPHITEGYRRIHGDDRPTVEAAVSAAVESCGSFRAEYRIVLPDGCHRWVAARGRALPGSDGTAARLVGAAYDITEARTAQDKAAHLLETMATGFASVDRDWRVTYINATGAQVVGRSSTDLVGQVLWEAFPGLEDTEFGRQYVYAMETGETVELEAHYEHLGGWYSVRAVPSSDGLAFYFLDITERHAHQERAEVAAQRMELLATVSAELAAATLSTRAAAARLADIVVPVLADWSVVTLVDEGEVRDIGWAHADTRLQPVAEVYARHRLTEISEQAAVWRARRTREPVLMLEGVTGREAALIRSPAAVEALEQLAPESSVVVPLLTKGEVVGVLSLYRGADRPPFSDEDVLTAGEIAGRAGLALDNARLYAQQRSLAEGLQRSLLTAPPEPAHCQIVVRYLPAAEVASVGGDWFDSFLQPEGATVLVIGDVVGHDVEAAAAMGQVRGLLRGVAWHSGAGPAEILTGVDAAIQGLELNTIATAVVGRLEQTPDELERGLTRLRWSNAGHPPPMVLNGDGTVLPLAGVAADLLLGIDPGTERVESEVVLDREATVLLYTDGLVERRDQDLDEGLAQLRDLIVELQTLPLDVMCDELLQRLAGDADDDVALLAVRLHRQDRPRPADAGPERLPPSAPPKP